MAPGGFVVHRASKVHYDGANDEDCVIAIYGMGPGDFHACRGRPVGRRYAAARRLRRTSHAPTGHKRMTSVAAPSRPAIGRSKKPHRR